MNDSRFIESCRIVSVSPCPPSSTSWWAISPARRTACTRTPSTSAPRAPSSAVVVASGERPGAGLAPGRGDQLGRTAGGAARARRPCSGGAARRSRRTRRTARPSAAKCIISTAPTAKLGAISTLTPGWSASRPRTVSSRSSSKPVVPDDRVHAVLDAPAEVVHDGVGVGEVDGHLAPRRAGPARRRRRPPRRAPGRRAASTARHSSAPTRPRAPSTPTLIMFFLPLVPAQRRAYRPGGDDRPVRSRGTVRGTGQSVKSRPSNGPMTLSVIERPRTSSPI